MSPRRKIETVEMDFEPRCPYCDEELKQMAVIARALNNRDVYACPHCRRLLAVGG